MEKKYITTTEAGKILGLDRTQVFRLVKAGKIPASKIGKTYVIDIEDLGVSGKEASKKDQKNVENAVDKVFAQYGDVIKKLGKE